MYTIGQISEMFQLPISTLRYYDVERRDNLDRGCDEGVEMVQAYC